MSRFASSAAVVSIVVAASPALAVTRQVGPGKPYAKPCAAFAAAQAGDTIEIDAAGNAAYAGDVCAVGPSNLTIRGVNGRAHIDAAGRNAQGKATWVVQGSNIVIENVEFSGAAAPDLNGAGIRAEGTNLTLRRCYFHDNQQGILGGAGEVLIEHSEFARNGNCIDPSGCAHNMYISGSVTKFTLRYSYSHDATDGHLVKSRARENHILYNRLTGESGTASYEINLPNAGTSYVIGNVIQQGTRTGNSVLLDYGSEGATNPGSDLYVVNNTFVNQRTAGGTFVSIAGGVSTPAVVKNNVFYGPGTAVSQTSAVLAHNFTGNPQFVNLASFDYHLSSGSPCINAAANPGSSPRGFSLVPAFEYVHPTSAAPRATVGALDIGAFEFGGGSGGAAGSAGSGAPGGVGGTGGSGASPGSCAWSSRAGSTSLPSVLAVLALFAGSQWFRRTRAARPRCARQSD